MFIILFIIAFGSGFLTRRMRPKTGLTVDLIVDGLFLAISVAIGSPLIALLWVGMGAWDIHTQTKRMRALPEGGRDAF